MKENDMKYDPAVWRGVSNKHRTVARLPEGMTGIEALKKYAPDEYDQLLEYIEQRAANTYRRIYADKNGDVAILNQVEWDEFKNAGGESSF